MKLAITRPPKPGESIIGYSLRLAEENYFPSLSWLVSLPEVHQDILSYIGKNLFGRVPRWLTEDSETQVRAWRGTGYYLLGEAARCCPQCLSEQPYWQAYWEHTHYSVCHIHSQPMIDQCPACDERITWARPCLTRCLCGHSFANSTPVPKKEVSQEETALAGLIFYKLNLPGTKPELEAAFCPDVFGLSVDGLSSFIQICGTQASGLGKRTKEVRRSAISESRAVSAAAADLLSSWPSRFYELLGNLSGFDELQNVSAMPKDGFLAFTKAVAKKFNADGLEFVLRAVREYMARNWYRALDGRNTWAVTSDVEYVHYVAAPNAARMLGISWSQLRQLISHGHIKAIQKRTDKNRKIWHVEKSSLEKAKAYFGDRMTTAGVAIFMGISELRVEELAEVGLLAPTENSMRANRYREFSKTDVVSLLDRLRAHIREPAAGKKL